MSNLSLFRGLGVLRWEERAYGIWLGAQTCYLLTSCRCGVCQIGLKGEKEAVEHAKATGHTNFSEY